jgi:hypothetical protein
LLQDKGVTALKLAGMTDKALAEYTNGEISAAERISVLIAAHKEAEDREFRCSDAQTRNAMRA